MEDFRDSQLDTSVQLQAIEAEQQKTEEAKRVAAIILPNSDSGEHNTHEPTKGDDEVLEVTMAPQPPEPTPSDTHLSPEVTADVAWEEPQEEPLWEPSADNRHEEQASGNDPME